MTQFPCPSCKASLTADEHQAQVSCSQCKQFVPVPSALPDWASQPEEGLPDWLAGGAAHALDPLPRKAGPRQSVLSIAARNDKPAEPAEPEPDPVAVMDWSSVRTATETPRPAPLPPLPRRPTAPGLPVKWIAAGGAAVVGLLVLTLGVVALAGNKTRNSKHEIADARDEREIQPARPIRPAENPKGELVERPTGLETPKENNPIEKPRTPAETAELLPAPLPYTESPPIRETSLDPTPVKEPIVKAPPKEEEELQAPPKMTTIAARPRDLSQSAKAGIAFLVKQQKADGGWSGGEMGAFGGIVIGRVPGAKPPEQTSDPANTSIAVLALMRSGFSPRQGNHSGALRKAIDFVCKAVEKSEEDALSLSDGKDAPAVRGFGKMATATLVQTKIGKSVDTYLAGLLLAEARGKMPNAAAEKRIYNALTKIQKKLETHQKADGTWGDAAWAPVLGQALASRALNRAGQVGVQVDTTKLLRAAKHARTNIDKGGKGGKGLVGAAGIALYAVASGIGGLHDAAITRKQAAEGARGILNSPSATNAEKTQAREQIKQADDSEKAFLDALRSVTKQVDNPNFVRGFGTDGGEEFISFVLIGEALRSRLPKQWGVWDKSIRGRLTKAQNRDGSWSGSHCITGKVFCTATAVMAMMTERAPVPASTPEK